MAPGQRSADYRKSARYRRDAASLGATVRGLRTGRGWTLEEAASRAGVDFRHLQRIESGQTNVTLATMLRLAEAFEVAPERLFPIAEPAPSSAATLQSASPSHEAEHNIKYGGGQHDTAAELAGAMMRSVGCQVSRLRREREMTQASLGAATGMSVQHVQRIESGRQNITLATLARLAVALGVEPAALVAAA